MHLRLLVPSLNNDRPLLIDDEPHFKNQDGDEFARQLDYFAFEQSPKAIEEEEKVPAQISRL